MSEQKINDGGPAFPVECLSIGMTIRDYFAAAALQSMTITGQYTFAEYANDAYQLADAMLKAREGKP